MLDLQLSETYCRIVLGMDNLYRSGKGSTGKLPLIEKDSCRSI